MNQDRLSFFALHLVPGVGNQLIKQLIGYCGSAEQVFKTPKGKLLKIPGIGPVTAGSIHSGSTFHQAEKEFKKAEKEETEILFFTDKKYPDRLKQIEDAPSLLYYKGNANLNSQKLVAIVGTRQATEYGKEIVSKIVEDLKPHNPIIVSGLAYGIDIQAHKQSLKNNLPTVAVMASGIDIIYPATHKDTSKKIVNHGGLLTENRFGVKPDPHYFPARNRIIAGMCDALIVVEAAEKGGALITAEIANSYNKDVFAIPGSLAQPQSQGCNKLIRNNKANIYTSIKDLEYLLNWTSDDIPKKRSINLSDFTLEEQKIIKVLQEKTPIVIDELTIKTELQPSLLASLLLTLEFGGLIKSLPGKQYALVN
ncbi:MAG: DNA-processing protein DprA [Cyclobacteriaceae bacterium]